MKKLLITLFALVTISIIALLGATTASAETEGDYTYSTYGSEATITGVKTSISGDITIPSRLGGCLVTNIGLYAFNNCTSLTSVTIPDSITTIGWSAFDNCTNLTSVIIPNSVTRIDSYAFDDCSSLTIITIPDSVTSIGSYAFQNCTSLTSIKLPNGITQISDFAFRGCKSLTSINVPRSVTDIGYYAFENCTSLTNVTIPDGVTTIGWFAFYGCSSLTSVTIGNSVSKIDNYDFYGCTSLTSVYIGSPQIAKSCENRDSCGRLIYCADTIYIKKGITQVGSYILSMPYKTEGVVVNGVTYTAYSKNKPPHTCSYKWANDSTNHWQICDGCDYEGTKTAHGYNNSCDTSCNTCGYVRTITHSFGTAWESNDNRHWHVCTVCGTPDTKSNHDYDNDSDADCNTCGHTRVIETPPVQTESSSTVDTVPDETTDGSGDKGGDGMDNVTVIIIAVAIAALGIVGGLVIRKIKKK